MQDNPAIQSLFEFSHAFTAKLPEIAIGLVIFIALVMAAAPISRWLIKPFGYVSASPLIHSVTRRSISILIMLLGAYLFLKLAGLTEFAVAIVSGTGLIGLVLGFAFRDIAENFISSLLLTVQRPFRIGDVVQIASYTGVVQKVTSRATTLVDFDGNHIQLPNATVYKGIIKNLTANPNMRGHFIIGVGYNSNIAEVRELAMQVLNNHDHVLQTPEPMVLIDNLGASTYNLKVYFWINVEATSVIKMASALMRILTETFLEAGISMPDDARERIFPEGLSLVNGKQAEHNALEQTTTQSSKPQGVLAPRSNAEQDHHQEDVTSENDDIRKQAEQSREPEDGSNILPE